MQSKLQPYIDENKLTFRKILLEFNKAKQIISARSTDGARLLDPPSRSLRDIFALLDIKETLSELV